MCDQKIKKRENLGYHILATFLGCDYDILNTGELLYEILIDAAKYGKMTPIGGKYQNFQPQGASAFVLLEESHIAIHSWPEFNPSAAALDIYTCGTEESCDLAFEMLKIKLKPKNIVDYEKRERLFIER